MGWKRVDLVRQSSLLEKENSFWKDIQILVVEKT